MASVMTIMEMATGMGACLSCWATGAPEDRKQQSQCCRPGCDWDAAGWHTGMPTWRTRPEELYHAACTLLDPVGPLQPIYATLPEAHSLATELVGAYGTHDSTGGRQRQASTPVATSAPKAAAMASIAALELMSSGAGPLKAIASAFIRSSQTLEAVHTAITMIRATGRHLRLSETHPSASLLCCCRL